MFFCAALTQDSRKQAAAHNRHGYGNAAKCCLAL
jgi:hypothetical protein